MLHSFHTDQELLEAIASSDRQATERVYKQHHRVVTRWIVQQGGEQQDAEDVYQEAMVVLYEKAQTPEFRLTCKIGTYLFAISKYLWYKRLQKAARQPMSLGEGQGWDEHKEWVYEDDIKVHQERELHYAQLYQAMEQLGEPCRSLLQAFYHKAKNMQEIATEFGYTNPDNAKNQKYKCLNRLRKLFYGVQLKKE